MNTAKGNKRRQNINRPSQNDQTEGLRGHQEGVVPSAHHAKPKRMAGLDLD